MKQEFEQVIRENHRRIRYIANRYAKASEADDVYQEILMQLWKSFESFSGEASRDTWLYRVALNTAVSFVRRTVKHGKIKEAVNAVSLPAIKHSVQDKCQAEILEKFMNSLGDIDANILMMYLDGMSIAEMAEVIGIKPNSITVRVKRIKLRFEEQYLGDE
ncbi:MAG: sigma-70 family RNA polymerase sigma factor, partial [Kangiellaceae bacterium]|nr:sigma-70 family RNA polymerase sigma factor [Kangiellaceae bacterium]MCW9000912.1 sigma-70 family RNA polymerase sigma factor [Kangiellaceae bacterium]